MEWEILAGLTEPEIRALLQTARRRTFARGEVVFHSGDPADTFHLVRKGRFAARVTTPFGDTATLGVIGKGAFFGELALLGDGGPPRSATVAALEDAETRSIHRLDFERLRRTNSNISDVLIKALVARVDALTGQLVEALYVPADQRLLRRLHDLQAKFKEDAGEPVIPLTQEELATFAGTSRATVNRVLRDAERRGEVALRRGRVIITDAPALARRCGAAASREVSRP